MAYGRRPKFVMAEHSATAEGENCAYGPTLLIVLHLSYAPSSTFVEKYNKKAVEKKMIKKNAPSKRLLNPLCE